MDIDSPPDDDPILSTYDIFLNTSLPPSRQLLILHQPNQSASTATKSFKAPPSQMRLKPKSGMVEIDVPMNIIDNYDRDKGMKWGRVLQESMAAKSGGSHGLGGGFGSAVPGRGAKKEVGRGEWSEEVKTGRVLHTRTLGGQNPDVKLVKYMVGVFHDRELHFTPVSSHIHLRPQLHHVDAATQAEKLAGSTNAPASQGPTASAAPNTQPARAIHMTIKTAENGEAVTTETMVDRLRSVQTEPWRHLEYTDENDDDAWDMYTETLMPLEKEREGDGSDKGKKQRDVDAGDLAQRVPGLRTVWDDGKMLQAVSGIKTVEREPIELDGAGRKTTARTRKPKDEDTGETETRKGKRGPRTAAAPRKGKGRAAASRSTTAMDLD